MRKHYYCWIVYHAGKAVKHLSMTLDVQAESPTERTVEARRLFLELVHRDRGIFKSNIITGAVVEVSSLSHEELSI